MTYNIMDPAAPPDCTVIYNTVGTAMLIFDTNRRICNKAVDDLLDCSLNKDNHPNCTRFLAKYDCTCDSISKAKNELLDLGLPSESLKTDTDVMLALIFLVAGNLRTQNEQVHLETPLRIKGLKNDAIAILA